MDIQLLDWTRAKPLAEPIRIAVFIDEQNVPAALEWDRWDDFAVHAVAIVAGRAVGTARLTRDGSIGRMAVLAGERRRGIGTALLQALVEAAEERGLRQLQLHAQSHAEGFYVKHGFVARGETFVEAGIPHIAMYRELT